MAGMYSLANHFILLKLNSQQLSCFLFHYMLNNQRNHFSWIYLFFKIEIEIHFIKLSFSLYMILKENRFDFHYPFLSTIFMNTENIFIYHFFQ